MSDQPEIPVTQVSTDLWVCRQVLAEELPAIQRQGFQSLINNRPDHEGGPTQPTSQTLGEAARRVGLAYEWVPVPPSGGNLDDAAAMAAAIKKLPKPILVFCRSGARSRGLILQAQTNFG